MKKSTMSFTAMSASGTRTISFPLHELTGDVDHVGTLLEALLAATDEKVRATGKVSDGDVLQALCMATAIRMHMVKAPIDTVRSMVAATMTQADDAVAKSRWRPSGSA